MKALKSVLRGACLWSCAWGFSAGLLIPSPGLAADEPVPGPAPAVGVSLATLVGEALSRNPEVRFYEGEIAAAVAGRRGAGRWLNPELTGSAGQKRTVDTAGALRGEGLAWSVSLAQPFEWPGRIGLRKSIANGEVDLARLGLERFRAALAARVRDLGYDLFASREKAVAAQEVADRFRALREVLVQRDPAGLTPLLELRIIEATDLTLQRRAGEAALRTRSALLELNQLNGRAVDARVEILPPALVFPPADPLGDLLSAAQTNNFDLRLRQMELTQQGFRVELARNERYPRFTVGPVISEERSGDRDRIVGVALSLPLPLWNRGGDALEAARARRDQAEAGLVAAQREVSRKVADASQRYEARVAEMGRWRPDSVERFREAAELADRHYRLGAVPVSVYVELQKQYLEAVESLLDTRREALEAAQALESLTGTGRPAVLGEVRP